MTNGRVGRFNLTLLQMLGTLEAHQKSDWKAHVPTLEHAYNATIHDSTGYSPYFLCFADIYDWTLMCFLVWDMILYLPNTRRSKPETS